MKSRNEELFLTDIRECCLKIERFTANVTKEDFLKNELLQDALVRNLEIIGEAAKSLSDETRDENPSVRWRDIMRMRDKIVHHYFRLNLETIWQTVTEDISILGCEIDRILEKFAK